MCAGAGRVLPRFAVDAAPPESRDEDAADEAREAREDEDRPMRDYQLTRALDLLRGLALYEERPDEEQPSE